MKLALFADIHSNLEALTTCLAHAEAQGAERWAFLGDLVGYGADPGPVLDIVMAYFTTGASVVLGNHDAAAIGQGTETMNENAERAIAWTRSKLSPGQSEFLAALPLTVREGELLFVHASAAAPDRWIYVTDPLRAAYSIGASGATYVLSGHVHEPVLYYQGADARPQPFRPVPGVPIPVPPHRRWLAIVGSCGQPRDGSTLATYALFDTARGELTYFRLPYDHHTAARKIRAAGLPEKLALRIERGR
jgi:diadenosine tetraphosphatase ApaH/serine/threonine PP2A family protein phosphatase